MSHGLLPSSTGLQSMESGADLHWGRGGQDPHLDFANHTIFPTKVFYARIQ